MSADRLAEIRGRLAAVRVSHPIWPTYATSMLSMPVEDVDWLVKQIDRLHERLEDSHVFDKDGKRVEVEPSSIPDGIDCRDETIKLLDDQIARLKAALATADAAGFARGVEAASAAVDGLWSNGSTPYARGRREMKIAAIDAISALLPPVTP